MERMSIKSVHSEIPYPGKSRNYNYQNRQEMNNVYNQQNGMDNRRVVLNPPQFYRNRSKPDHDAVRIIPQDDDWGDAKSDRTTNTTSETAYSVITDGTAVFHNALEKYNVKSSYCSQLYSSLFTMFIAGIVFIAAFISPIIMFILPKLGLVDGWKISKCDVECDGIYISIGSKILLALIGSWAIFFRSKLAIMPRNFTIRTFLTFLSMFISLIFWLYYVVKIAFRIEERLDVIVRYASTYLDTQLFLHYVAILLLEIRQMRCKYSIEMVRSPDGFTKNYIIGQLSIQRTAVQMLQFYFNDFPGYNPHLERYAKRRARLSTFKIYNVNEGPNQNVNNDAMIPQMSNEETIDVQKYSGMIKQRMKNKSRNDRFYEEVDYERRVQRRKVRLMTAAEESFNNVRRLNNDISPPLTSREAAEAVFATLGNPLKKYLRITRQQQKYNLRSIIDYLALCLSNDMGPKTFVNRYVHQGNVIYNTYTISASITTQLENNGYPSIGRHSASEEKCKDKKIFKSSYNKSLKREKNIRDSWKIICSDNLSGSITHGTIFRLKQSDVSLLVTCRSIPQFYLQEHSIGLQDNFFTLVVNSETSI
ncbi:Van Gogh-like protein 2 [Intoshia linei]|uniref:Van Gogh-like protein 2 n=1 Tax=Intoshia linei TaxID=1819745 RepID=A0A177ATG1_9BILA|nr:Van Gogh-like protein 2 [Intoshia linei]